MVGYSVDLGGCVYYMRAISHLCNGVDDSDLLAHAGDGDALVASVADVTSDKNLGWHNDEPTSQSHSDWRATAAEMQTPMAAIPFLVPLIEVARPVTRPRARIYLPCFACGSISCDGQHKWQTCLPLARGDGGTCGSAPAAFACDGQLLSTILLPCMITRPAVSLLAAAAGKVC
jgi:hypothetical protein